MGLFLAFALKPFFLLLALFLLGCIRLCVIRYMPRSRLKDLLLREV